MKLLLLVVGRTVDKHLSALIDDYAGRIKHYVPFELEVIPELKNAKSLSFEQQKEREGELLLRSLKDGDAVWLLDEGGREFRSVEFAAFLDRQHSSGARRLVFVVWSLRVLTGRLCARQRQNFAFAPHLFPPNGALVFHRAALSRHDDPPRRTLSPRIAHGIILFSLS